MIGCLFNMDDQGLIRDRLSNSAKSSRWVIRLRSSSQSSSFAESVHRALMQSP